MVMAGLNYKFVHDQIGTIRQVIAPDGSVAQQIDYDEFGNVVADSAAGFQPFGFAGGLRDIDSGLVRFGSRDYDPETGRWTSKDPLRFTRGRSNVYAYVGNDPVNLIDPTGRDIDENGNYFFACKGGGSAHFEGCHDEACVCRVLDAAINYGGDCKNETGPLCSCIIDWMKSNCKKKPPEPVACMPASAGGLGVPFQGVQ
jgi:RHS repeat-associated protein